MIKILTDRMQTLAIAIQIKGLNEHITILINTLIAKIAKRLVPIKPDQTLPD
jgi:hypothetical protein